MMMYYCHDILSDVCMYIFIVYTGYISISDDTTDVIISAVEFYEFRYVSTTRPAQVISRKSVESSAVLPLAPGSEQGGDTVLPKEQVSPVVKCTLDDLLVCFPSHMHNIHNGTRSFLASGSGQEYSPASHQNAFAIINASQDLKHVKSKQGGDTEGISRERHGSDSSGSYGNRNIDPTLLLQAYQQQPNSQTNDGESSNFNNSSMKSDFQVPLEKIHVQVHYRDLKHGSVVDNDYYTTLLPSKLPPSAWSAKATFAPTSLQSNGGGARTQGSGGFNYLDILSPPAVSPLLATSLRRLLALYVCGKSAR